VGGGLRNRGYGLQCCRTKFRSMFTEWHQGNGKEQDFDKTHWFAELDNKSLEIRTYEKILA
jgi:hypothetical protein